MAVLQMQRVSICALKKNRKEILETLQRMGVMEVNHVIQDDEDFSRVDMGNAKSNFEKAAASANQALDVLMQYAPVKTSMLSALAGKDLIEKETFQSVLERRALLQKTTKRICALDKKRAEVKANVLKLEDRIESLTPWIPLGVPLNYGGTKHMSLFTGAITGQVTLEQAYAMLAEQEPELEINLNIISSERDTTYLAVLCLRQKAKEVEEALRGVGFARPSQITNKVPAEAKADMEQEISKLQMHITEIEAEVAGLAIHREELRLLADYYCVRADKYDVLETLPQSEHTFIISGYVPKKDVPRVRKNVEGNYDCAMDVDAVKEEEEAPVVLKNNSFSRGAESILESFGLPKKGEFDPTAIMSVFYMFFFGLMLSDAAYGAIISVACGVLLLKFPRMSRGMQQAFQLFFWCGISTLFWGIMFGGYFGDAINVISKTFFGHEIGIPAVWFVPLDEPMKLLMYSMLFGVIHLFVGLGLRGYICLKNKRFMDFFCDVILWFMLLIGLLIMVIPSSIFTSIAQTTVVFPPIINTLGKALAIVGALGILLMSGRRKKNVGLRIALGAYDLYNVSGWLSDILSYSRLLALGLATGVIASVVNQMGSMGGNSIFGVIVFIFAFILGHTFNLGINLLGAYVHTNRLQFVEFFGKFYEGGGRAFHPFKENTKYTDIRRI